MYQVINSLSKLPEYETDDLAKARNFKTLLELLWGSPKGNDAYEIIERKGDEPNE